MRERFVAFVAGGKPSRDAVLLEEVDASQREYVAVEVLRKRLRRFPYWYDGHVHIARLLLQLGEVEQCYAACQTALILAETEQQRREPHRILCSTYLRAGRFQEVRGLVEPLQLKGEATHEETELLAAALMGLGEKEQAGRLLEGLPTSRHGGKTGAVLSYLKK